VDEQHASDWFKARKSKGAKSLTKTAWDAVKAEALNAGVTPAEAVKIAAENTWQGFKASWMSKPAHQSQKSGKHHGFDSLDYSAGVNHDGSFQ